MGSLWLVIAKQELRILTSRFRTHRKLVLVILASVLVAWGVLCSVIMPAIHGAPFNPALETQIGLLFAPIIELALFLLFIYFFIIPISATIQESESKQFDLIISAPVKPGDVFIGQFIGKQPVYVIIALFLSPLAGFVLSLFSFSMRVNVVAHVVLAIAVVAVLLLATLLGTIVAFWLSKKINNIKGAKDKAKALLVVFSVLVMILFYSMGQLGQAMILDPGLRNTFQFIPSTWIANLVNAIAFPSVQPVVPWFGPGVSTAAFAGLWVAIAFVSYTKAGAFFSFEGTSLDEGTISRTASRWTRYFTRLSPRKNAGIIVFLAKEFFRKMENLAKLGFSIGVVIIILVFMPVDTSDGLTAPVFYLFLVSWMFAMMAGFLLGSYVLISGKDMLFLYKKSPVGIHRYVHSSVHFHFLVALPLIIAVTIIVGVSASFEMAWIMLLFVALMLNTYSSITLSTAIQCFRPAYQERSPTMTINIFIYMGVMVMTYLGFMLLLFAGLPTEVFEILGFELSVMFVSLAYPVFMILLTRLLLRVAVAKLYHIE